jgi:DNA mismatch repair protein MSH5
VPDSTSTRAPSESVTRDSRASDLQVDDTINEVVMSVDLTTRGTVGCCYYIARDEKMFFMEDIQFGDVDVIEALRMFIDPTVILVSTKIDDAVIDRFDPEARNSGSVSRDNDQFRLPFLLDVRPPSEFFYDAARSKLVNLHLGEHHGSRVSFNVPGELSANDRLDEDNIAGRQGQLLRLAGWIDIESRTTVKVHFQACATSANTFARSPVLEHSSPICRDDVLLHIFPVINPRISCSVSPPWKCSAYERLCLLMRIPSTHCRF